MKKEIKSIDNRLRENLLTKLYYTEKTAENKDSGTQFMNIPITYKFLENWFNIENKSFQEAFEIVAKGIGDEITKMSSIISSSLLSLLCFHKLYNNQNDNRLIINFKDYGVEDMGEVFFDDCMFEVRNKVIGYQFPSCIDLLLISHSSKILLFLESKFTEPIVSQYKRRYGKSYLPLYSSFKEYLEEIGIYFKEDTDTDELILYTKEDHKYIDGIKQAISHIIGISRGPSDNDKGYYPLKFVEKYKNLFNNPSYKKLFGTILYDHDKLTESYIKDFKSFFKSEHSQGIINSINTWNEGNYEKIENLQIINTPFTYQKLFNYKRNKQLLNDNIINFYGF